MKFVSINQIQHKTSYRLPDETGGGRGGYKNCDKMA